MTTYNFVPADMTDINILRNYMYKIEWNCKSTTFPKLNKDFWKWMNAEVCHTTKQLEWKWNFGFCFNEELNCISHVSNSIIPQKIKCWYRDLLNFNIKVWYHKDCCRLCGDEIGGSHFVFDCPNIKTLQQMFRKYILCEYRDIAIIRWMNWIAYCKFTGDTTTTNIEAIRAVRKTFVRQIFIDGIRFLK